MNKVLQEKLQMTEEEFKACGGREWVYRDIAHKMIDAMDPGQLQKLFCIKEAWGTSEEIRKKIQDPSVSEEEKEKLRNLATNKLIEYKAEIEFHPWIRLPLKRYVI